MEEKLDPIDRYIDEIPSSLHDVIYTWDRPHQMFHSMLDRTRDINLQKPFDIVPRKIHTEEFQWFEKALKTNNFLKSKKLEERKLLYQISTLIILEEEDDILFRQGDKSDSFFILLYGRLDCIVSTDNTGESADDIYASSRVKTKKEFSTKRALKKENQKKVVVRGQRVGGHKREVDLHGIVVGTFERPGQSFGETALTKTKNVLHRRASIVAKEPCILLRIGAKEYFNFEKKWRGVKTKMIAKFLRRMDFLSHWSMKKIATLSRSSCQLLTFPKNHPIQKKNDPILNIYIVFSGAIRKMEKMPGSSDTIMETKHARVGDMICCQELVHHVTHSSFVAITAADFFTTDVIRVNQNGFLMIEKDEIAFSKLQNLVRCEDFTRYNRIVEKYETIQGRPMLVRKAYPTNLFEKESRLTRRWDRFRSNLVATVKSIPSHNKDVGLKLELASKQQKVKAYMDQKLKKDGATYNLTQLRLLVAEREDNKINENNKKIFESLANKVHDEHEKNKIEKIGYEEECFMVPKGPNALLFTGPPPARKNEAVIDHFRLKSPNGRRRKIIGRPFNRNAKQAK